MKVEKISSVLFLSSIFCAIATLCALIVAFIFPSDAIAAIEFVLFCLEAFLGMAFIVTVIVMAVRE